MKEKFNEKVIPIILKFINTKGIQSIKNGMVTSMSPLIIGSIFLILSNFPVKAVVDVLESTGIKAVLDQACGATFSISAMIAVIGISYSYAKLENQEPLNCAIISLASFLILMPSSITTESGEVVTGIINKTWTAGQGMIGAIIVGLIVPLVYCWFLKKNIRIKMPAGVPEGVTNAFSALIPAFVILTGTAVIHGICSIGFNRYGNYLQSCSDTTSENDRLPWWSSSDVLYRTIPVVLRSSWFNSSWWNHDRTITGKQPCKSGYY